MTTEPYRPQEIKDCTTTRSENEFKCTVDGKKSVAKTVFPKCGKAEAGEIARIDFTDKKPSNHPKETF